MYKYRVIDLETTGLEPDSLPCEYASIDLMSTGQNGLLFMASKSDLLNPGIPIPANASGIHHITTPMVQGKQSFEDIKDMLGREVRNRYFIAHNANFEKRFFEEKPWICTMVLARRLWPESPDHKLGTLRYYLNLRRIPHQHNLYRGMDHRAMTDAAWTTSLLKTIIETNGTDHERFVKWATKPAWLERIPFGKHKGKRWGNVPPQWLHWLKRDPTPKDLDTAYNLNLALARKH